MHSYKSFSRCLKNAPNCLPTQITSLATKANGLSSSGLAAPESVHYTYWIANTVNSDLSHFEFPTATRPEAIAPLPRPKLPFQTPIGFRLRTPETLATVATNSLLNFSFFKNLLDLLHAFLFQSFDNGKQEALFGETSCMIAFKEENQGTHQDLSTEKTKPKTN